MVTLFTRNRRIENLCRNEFKGEATGGLEVKKPSWHERPKRADYALTTNNTKLELERFAAGVGAMLIVLPEGIHYLVGKCKLAHYAGKDVTLVGVDYREPNKDGD